MFLHKNICCGYSLEVPHRGTSNEYPQHMFSRSYDKNVYLIPPHISFEQIIFSYGIWIYPRIIISDNLSTVKPVLKDHLGEERNLSTMASGVLLQFRINTFNHLGMFSNGLFTKGGLLIGMIFTIDFTILRIKESLH